MKGWITFVASVAVVLSESAGAIESSELEQRIALQEHSAGQGAEEGAAAGKSQSIWGPILFAGAAAGIAATAIVLGMNSTKAPKRSTTQAH